MGSESHDEKHIPIINLSKEIERGSEEWIAISKEVREACEDHGCFEVIFEQISKELRDELFSATNKLYLSPMEIKKKNINPNPFMAYACDPKVNPVLESFGIEDASNYDSLDSFAKLIMADDDPLAQHHFCETMNTTVKTLNDLHQTIRNLIVDSYGIGNKEDTIATMATKTLVRTMRYKPHLDGEDIKADYRHTDKPLCTLLIQDECSGLEVKTKDGEWNLWVPTHPNSLMFNVGDPLMAWSNGRLYSMYHRVSVKRGNARHTIASFLFPVKDTIIKPDEVFIDEKHPKMFKEFNHTEYLKYCHPKDPNLESDELVWKFAGL